MLGMLVRGPHPGIILSKHYVGDGDIVYKHACKARLRRHCVEAARLTLPLGPIDILA